MNKIDVLLVDDERLHREGMKFLLNKMDNCFRIKMANNGEKALELLENEKFQLLITDIKMPIMDGMELIKYVRKVYPDLHVVICSAHNDFQYAKQALKNEVKDYLIKPVNRSEFKELIMGIIEELMVKKGNKKLEVASHIFETIHGRKPWDIKKELLQLGWVQPWQFSLVYTNYMGKRLSEELERRDCICIQLNHYENLILHRFADKQKYQEAKDYYKGFYSRLKREDCKEPIFVMSEMFYDISDISTIYQQIYELGHSKKYKGTSGLWYHEKRSQQYIYSDKELNQYMEAFMDDIANNHLGQLKNSLNNLFEELYKANYSLIFMKYVLCEVAKKILDNTGRIDNVEALVNSIMVSNNLRDVQDKLLSLIPDDETIGYDKYIIQTLDYIHEAYASDISLEVLASRIYLTPSYLSLMFKKETGTTVTEYIVSYRMRKAQKMVTKTNMKISHISKEVGYSNVPYFTTLFKKYFGMTPSVMRKQG